MERKRTVFAANIPWRTLLRRVPISRLLPTPGNVVFTLLTVFGLLWAQNAGAMGLRAVNSPTASTTTIPYQGRLADTSGNPLTGTYAMTFRLYAAASGGSALWTETWTGGTGVHVNAGLFNVMLGSYTPIPQSVLTANSTLWLGITVGADAEMLPRVQLGSVPFAMQALTVPDGSVTTAKIANAAVIPAKLDRTYLPLSGGTVSYLEMGVPGQGEGGEITLNEGTTGSEWIIDNYFGLFRLHNGGVTRFAVDTNGNTIATGTKSATVKTDNHGVRKLYSVEAADVRFTDEGIATMKEGSTRVELDPVFVETVEGEYVITVTPYGDASLYIADVGATYFTVRSRDSNANVRLAWRVSAHRKGYADERLERVETP